MDACLIFCVCFSFSVLSQEISLEERLQNDMYLCQVGCKTLTQSINIKHRSVVLAIW